MKENICTIPINDVFAPKCGCGAVLSRKTARRRPPRVKIAPHALCARGLFLLYS